MLRTWCLFLPLPSDAIPNRHHSSTSTFKAMAVPLLRSPMTVRHSCVPARANVCALRQSYAPMVVLAQASTSSEQPTTGLPSTILRMNGSPSIAQAIACARRTLRLLATRPRGERRTMQGVKDFNEQQNVVLRPTSTLKLSMKFFSVIVNPIGVKQNDTDIRAENDTECLICNVPTKFDSRGIILLNIPILCVALAAVGGMLYLRSLRRR